MQSKSFKKSHSEFYSSKDYQGYYKRESFYSFKGCLYIFIVFKAVFMFINSSFVGLDSDVGLLYRSKIKMDGSFSFSMRGLPLGPWPESPVLLVIISFDTQLGHHLLDQVAVVH